MENPTEKNKTIIRVVHNRENPYAQLNKKSIWDKNLSLKAVGLWTRCLSRPDDWSFCISELVKRCKEGRKAVDAAMKELIENGYVIRLEIAVKDENGKFCGKATEFIFFECPATEEEKAEQTEIFKKSYAYCQKGNLQNGNFQNGELLIKSSTNTEKKEERKKESKPKKKASAKADASLPSLPSSVIPEKIDRALHVRTSEADHQKLITKHGQLKTDELYEILSLWKQKQSENDLKKLINGDYARIITWGIKSHREKELAQQRAKEDERRLAIQKAENDQREERIKNMQSKPNQRNLMEEALKKDPQQKQILSKAMYDRKVARGEDVSMFEVEGVKNEAN